MSERNLVWVWSYGSQKLQLESIKVDPITGSCKTVAVIKKDRFDRK